MNLTAALSQKRPHTGRSRFSKALPAPPPLLDISSFGLPLDLGSPLSPTVEILSPKRVDKDYTKPLDSPLPPLPLTTPRKMSIPRKPISLPASPMTLNRIDQGREDPLLLPPPPPPPPPPKKDDSQSISKEAPEAGAHSPAFSFSSLLSAYTTTSIHSAAQSDSDSGSRATSTLNSDASGSPAGDSIMAAQDKQQPVKFPPRKDSRSYKTNISSFIAEQAPAQKEKLLPTPPPPRHDSLRRPQDLGPETPQQQHPSSQIPAPMLAQARTQAQAQAQTQTLVYTSEAADAGVGVVQVQVQVQPNPGPSLLDVNGASSSPPLPELWRRRSSSRADKNPSLPELKLETTNGSTAPRQGSGPAPLHQHLGELPGASTHIPPGSNALPGRNIRPVATRPAPAPPLQKQNILPVSSPSIDEQMGQTTSRIRRKSLGPRSAAIATYPNAPSPNKPIQPKLAMVARPPTPEYQNNDIQSPIVETVMSPASPASSPEPNQPFGSATVPKQSIRRRPVGSPTSPTAASLMVRPVESTLAFPVSPISPVSAVSAVSAISMRSVSTSPNPENMAASAQAGAEDAATREVEVTETSVVEEPAQTASVLTPHMAVVMAAVYGHAMPELPIPVNPPLSAQDGNWQAGNQVVQRDPSIPSRSAEKRASSHVYAGIPVALGTIIESAPLTIVHYQCFKQHKHFRQSPNINCPLTCQTCHRPDLEMRWRCNWCALRICRGCLDMLIGSNRDLYLVMDKLNHFHDQTSNMEGGRDFVGSGDIENENR